MAYFSAGRYKDEPLELQTSLSHGQVNVLHAGILIGSLQPHEVTQLVQWLVNHDKVDLAYITDRKQFFDEAECKCTGSGAFSKGKPSCPTHFAVG